MWMFGLDTVGGGQHGQGFLPKLASQPHPTGADPCVCAGPCSGALHPAGDLLVGAAQNGCFKPCAASCGWGNALPGTLTQAEGTGGHWLALLHSLPTMPCPGCRERMDLKAPIYFSTGLTEKANHYYKLFIPWTNQKIRKTFVQRNMFEFKHIKAFDRAFADSPGPMVCPGAAGGVGGWKSTSQVI